MKLGNYYNLRHKLFILDTYLVFWKAPQCKIEAVKFWAYYPSLFFSWQTF